MPNKRSAMKALRQDKVKTVRNNKYLAEIKTLSKKIRQAVAAKDSKAEELLAKCTKVIDKAVQKKVLKKNTGARQKSRLMKLLNNSQKPTTKTK